jgi:uncharacterized protein (DUF2147 family)
LIALLPLATSAQAAADPRQLIVGNWLTADRGGIIQISLAPDGSYVGRIAGGNQPGRLDTRNPEESLRGRSLLGAILLRDLHYDGEGKWSGGLIYDPNNGHTYHCNAQLVTPNELKLRGYLGFSLIGRNELWTRYTGTRLELPPAH